ncbi:gamma-glutamyl-gamma-aminobutyrate hydrolase [Lentilactobacillus curieae]|uniref:Gamma-glutamyl-gamma-aminobutyrate hydrolase n=1 Tax=Lentilactobacillus curieae TaxID=1138822 RepID=A0A1S6QH55_9LACO|nr:gamma-glutamyl-gamma-aminobutyrate hydrolase family protein [Lentilactobacillus curieae]AQW20932.1 gamma-glutamyl-gamma-aminobutyrate hydrolase [Lentilactobacillus curieae]
MKLNKPTIGIPAEIRTFNGTLRNNVNEGEVKAILRHGGLPLLIPTRNPDVVTEYLPLVDGLLLPGGTDVAPRFYGEEPIPQNGDIDPLLDESEIRLIKEFIHAQKPIFALCRGMQILNVAMGGNLYQDIESQIATPVFQHSQKNNISETAHYVDIESESKLASIVNTDKLLVNSHHHQAIKQVADELHVTAKSGDGIIEAVENSDGSIMGVQWHPELMFEGDVVEDKLFEEFLGRVKSIG